MTPPQAVAVALFSSTPRMVVSPALPPDGDRAADDARQCGGTSGESAQCHQCPPALPSPADVALDAFDMDSTVMIYCPKILLASSHTTQLPAIKRAPRNTTVPVLLYVGIVRVHFAYLNRQILKIPNFVLKSYVDPVEKSMHN